MRSNCVTCIGGELVVPKSVIEFILGARHSSQNVKVDTERALINNLVEYLFVHLPYLRIELYVDLAATFHLFLKATELEGYTGWEIGCPKILVSWMRYYSNTRLADYDFCNRDHVKKAYWWMVEDLLVNKNVCFEDLAFILFHSDHGYFNNDSFQLDAYFKFYDLEIPCCRSDGNLIYGPELLKMHKSGQWFFDTDASLTKAIVSKPELVIVHLFGVEYQIQASLEDIGNLMMMEAASVNVNTDSIVIHADERLLAELVNNINIFGIDFIYSILILPLFFTSSPCGFVEYIYPMINATDLSYVKKIYNGYINSRKTEIDFAHARNIKNAENCVIGRFTSGSGVGEDARMFHLALSRISDPVVSIDTESFNKSYSNSCNLFNLSICCMPPWDYLTERLRYPSIGKDCNFFAGYWPWELPNIPDGHNFIYDDFDIILVPSKFVADCFEKYTTKPVKILTAPVQINSLSSYNKTSNDQFTFLVMFDCGSSIHRKNPFAAVDAFIQLYGNKPDYCLIVKTMNGSESNIYFNNLKSQVNAYNNIKLINEQLPISEVYSLINKADCYISTHRSEGFGRILAESMLLKTPTITSNWSGNVDFCNENTSYLVDGELVPVKDYEYGFSSGQYWFNADVDSLLNAMTKVTSKNIGMVDAAYKFVENHYSVERTSIKLKAMVDEFM